VAEKKVEKPQLLTRAEAGERFRVEPRSITRWTTTGELVRTRTPEGDRYDAKQINEKLGTDEDLLTPGEVAKILGVSPKAVARRVDTGELSNIRTPGGHHRYIAREVRELAP
jgi:excisionase family DNA binding protein